MDQAIIGAAEEFRAAVSGPSSGELCFPTSVDAGLRVLKAVEDPGLGQASLARIVLAEPLLSAKLVRLANSAALNPHNQTVYDVRQAVLRVGVDLIRSLAVAVIVDQLRHASAHGEARAMSNRLWERSVHVAALSYVLARRMTCLNPDEAMFAGIVKDLGRFYLLSQLAGFPALFADRAMLSALVNDLSDEVSDRVFGELALPANVVAAVRSARGGCGTMPPVTPGELLFLASTISPRRDPFDELDTRLPASPYKDGVLGFDQATLNAVMTASGDEINSIVVALDR